ncbi:unnamed protein product, partial [Ixodes pacificus]
VTKSGCVTLSVLPGWTRPSKKFAGCEGRDPASTKTKRCCFWGGIWTSGPASRGLVSFCFVFHACVLECGGLLRGTLWGKGRQCERETRKQQTEKRNVESVELNGSGPGPDWGRLRRRGVCV